MGRPQLLLAVLLGVGLLTACANQRRHHGTESNKLSGVTVGNQVWASTNLDVGFFSNGDVIPEVRSNEEWVKAGKEGRPAWCYYENDGQTGKTYGRMYNWYAVNDPRGLCPTGWHVPTNEEWIALENYLGVAEAGTKLKCEKGWKSNGGGSNSSGLCVLPGGYRDRNGRFTGVGEFLYLTSKSDGQLEAPNDNKGFIWGRGVQFENKDVMRCELDKEFGLYVRCVKDKP